MDGRAPSHHGSHRELLRPVQVSRPSDGWVDLLVVPSSRPNGFLREAIRLAQHLECVLLVLASGRCSATQIMAQQAQYLPDHLVAVDLPPGYAAGERVVQFEVDRLVAERRPLRRSDISVKRNLALLIGRYTGAERMLFLDDDIVVPDWVDILRASSALNERFAAVGMEVRGFPDNSVVCHANRLTGGDQDTFVGGGALMLDPQRANAFFPDVYNEDWFFLLESAITRSIAITGVVAQRLYDPFASPARAEREEFGDVLAEGIYWLLDEKRLLSEANEDYWGEALQRRRKLIGQIIARQDQAAVPPLERKRMVDALKAAEAVRQSIRPQHCAAYVRQWSEDQESWAKRLGRLPTDLPLEIALKELGLPWLGSLPIGASVRRGHLSSHRPSPKPLRDARGKTLWTEPKPTMLAEQRP